MKFIDSIPYKSRQFPYNMLLRRKNSKNVSSLENNNLSAVHQPKQRYTAHKFRFVM